MARLWFLIVAALVPSLAFADCGEITRRLFGIEIGGPRTYLTNLPAGISLYPDKREWLTAGIDAVTGKSHELNQLSLQAQIHWHENRVVAVLATIRGASDSDIASARDIVITMSGTEFRPNTVPPNQFLHCGDGLRTQLVTSQIVRSKESVTPLLIVSVEHSKLKDEMQNSLRSRDENDKRLRSAAEAGDARAQTILAKSLSKSDRMQARQWLRRAAEAGYAEAQHDLAKSLGVFSDPESWLWFEKAASQGYEQTVIYLRGVMAYRICDAQYGRKYLELLKKVVTNAGQHEKVRQSAEAALSYAISFREKNPGRCD